AIRRERPLSEGTPSPTSTSHQLSAMRIGDSSSEQSDAMASMPPLTQYFVHHDVSPSSTSGPSATPDDEMPALAPGQKDRLDRVMIEPDGSSWRPAKEAAQALKDCVRRLHTQAYQSWSEIPNSIRQAMFNEFKNTDKFKEMSEQAKKARGSLKGGSLHTEGAKTIETIAREMLGLEGIGSSRQGEALDGVQIVVMSAQIAQLISALIESERRRVAEQQSMSETVQQIKE
ncbi:hypothetical protein MTR67_044134, partial [Solanum verrucosum]